MHVFDDAEIARITGGRLIWPGAPGPIEADRRKPLTGCWFVALAGDGFDDHAFVGEVVAQGAAGVIVERPVAADAGVVCVDDTWRALRDMARFARERFAGPVVGITGSCGKTTTRQMTALALSPLGVVNENPGSSNAEPGVALTLLNAPADAVAQVVEVGLGRPDGVALLVDVVRPDVRVITNVGPAHLDVAGSVAGVARQKAPMFTTAQAGDVCVGATDDAAVAAMVRPAGVRREDVGASGRFRLLSAAPVDDLAVHARWATPEGEVEARLSTPAPHMAQNATFALAVAHVCGVSMAAAVQALERFRPMAGRLRPLRTHDGVRVIDDAFNANPVSMASALRVLGSLPGPRRAVLGDMLALGREEAAHHEALLALAKRVGLEQLIVVGEAFGRAARSSDSVCCVPSPDRAVEALRSELRPGDVVLVKGSHAVGLGAVIAALVPESQR